MAKSVRIQLTPKQSSAYHLLTNPDDAAVLLGGAKGGGKSLFLCVWVKIQVERLIQQFGLKPTQDPIALGFMGRKRAVDFMTTTLETFKRTIPADHYRIADQGREIIFHETAKVACGGLDDRERIRKFNSAEYAFLAIDQAEETERTDVDVLQATLRLKINGIQPAYKQLYTANPADCWLKSDFIDTRLPKHHFVPALYTDNPHLPTNYRETLEAAFRHSEPLLRAYRDGDWYALQAVNQLITSRMLELLKDKTLHPKEIRRIVSCDPSLGGDECVIYAMENGTVLEERILHERDTMKIAGHMQVLANQHGIRAYSVDVIGIGQGIYDRLRELRKTETVIALNSAQPSSDPERWSNTRTEMWWYVMTEIQEQRIPYPEDEELRRQLCAPRFKVINSNGKVQLEPKEETKKRLGRSPDRADAFVQGLFTMPDTAPVKAQDAWASEASSEEIGVGVESAWDA